jgi:hypothetical protein
MTSFLTRIVSAIRKALGIHDPNEEPMTPGHGWLLPNKSKPAAPVAPRG